MRTRMQTGKYGSTFYWGTWGLYTFEPTAQRAVARVVTGQISPEEGIADYRRQIGAIGGQAVLYEANAAIGKTSSSVYRY